jgi:hypothetical protein
VGVETQNIDRTKNKRVIEINIHLPHLLMGTNPPSQVLRHEHVAYNSNFEYKREEGGGNLV